jgi:chemotaxis response regulator CheB
MINRLLPLVIVAAAIDLAAPALARDEKAAADCAGKLNPDGRAMFDSVAKEVKPDTDLRALMREKAIPMVMFGSLTRESAQANGPAAGACAVLLK